MSKRFAVVCLGALLLGGFAVAAQAGKAVHIHWVCSYCGSRMTSVRMPSEYGCTRNPYGKTHSWVAESAN